MNISAPSASERVVMLISHHAHPEIVTGAEKVLLMLGAALLEMRLKVVWISPGPGLSVVRADQMGMESRIIPFPLLWSFIYSPGRLGDEIGMLQMRAEGSLLDQAIAEISPSLIIANSAINAFPLVIAQKRKIPVWWYIHETVPSKPETLPLLALIHGHGDRILVPSAIIAQSLASAEQRQIDLLPYGVVILDHLFVRERRKVVRQTLSWTDSDAVIGWFGSIYAGKGLIELIRACRSLKSQEKIVLLAAGNIGDDDYFRMCQEEAKWMEAVEYHYLGALPDISDLLLAVDMVVVPSLVEEAFPNVALEAMALSICIVAYKSGGLKEIVIDGKTGMLIDKGDTASLGAAIQKLIDEPDIRAAMGQQGRQRAVELYHYDNFKRLVNAMISQQGGRGPV